MVLLLLPYQPNQLELVLSQHTIPELGATSPPSHQDTKVTLLFFVPWWLGG
jgi:hypothetical protein